MSTPLPSSESTASIQLQSLTTQAQTLSEAVDSWNAGMVWALAITVVAAIMVLVTTKVGLQRAKQLADVQERMLSFKDDELARDLKAKDASIAAADANAAHANALAAEANSTQQRVAVELAKQQVRAAEGGTQPA